MIQVAEISKTQNCTTKEVMSGELAQLCWIYSASFAQDLLHICNSGRNDKQERLRTYVALTSNNYVFDFGIT